MPSKPIRNRVIALGAACALAAVVAVVVLALINRTNFCAEGKQMAQARLLDMAARDYARKCPAKKAAVRKAQARADGKLARATVLYRVQRANEAAATQAKARAKKAKASAETAAASAETAAASARKAEAVARNAKAETAEARARQTAKARTTQARIAGRRMRRRYIAALEIFPFRAGARKAFRTALRGMPAPRTMQQRTARCALARKLLDARLPAEARLVAYQVAATGRGDSCRAELDELRSTQGQVRKYIREARSLEERDELKEMREELVGAVELDPSRAGAVKLLTTTVPVDESWLEYLGGQIGNVDDVLGDAAAWLVPLLIALLVLAALAFTLLRSWLAQQTKRNRDWAEAGRRHPLRWLRRAATLNVRVGALGAPAGAAAAGEDFSALLVDALPRVSVGSAAFPFDRVSGESETEQNVAKGAEFLAGIPQTKLLGTVVKLLTPMFRSRSAEISGRLVPDGDAGVGVAMTVTGDRGRLSHSVALWEDTYDAAPGGDGAARFLRLVPPAAVWARWHLAPALDADGQDGDAWQADAMFAAGEAWQANSDNVRAGVCYAKVLALDPDHLAAEYNLALLEVRSGAYAPAIDRLQGLIARLDGEALERWPMLDYAPYYLLAVALVYEGDD